jgi:hypothetical protein
MRGSSLPISCILLLLLLPLYPVKVYRSRLGRCNLVSVQPLRPVSTAGSVLCISCPLSCTDGIGILDDDHFLSKLVDIGHPTYYIEPDQKALLNEKWDTTYENVVLEAVEYIKRNSGKLCTVVSCGVSALPILRLLSVLPPGRLNGVVLLDPPPLHAVATESGRRRILNRFLGEGWTLPSFHNDAVGVSPCATKKVRLKCRTAPTVLQARAPSTMATQTLVEGIKVALQRGDVTTADLLGEGPPTGAEAVARRLGPGGLAVVCTDLLSPLEGAGLSGAYGGVAGAGDSPAVRPPNHSTKFERTPTVELSGVGTEEGLPSWHGLDVLQVSAEDQWGPAAVEELAAVYKALPVLYTYRSFAHCHEAVNGELGSAGGALPAVEHGPERHCFSSSAAEVDICMLARHVALANIVSNCASAI